MLFVHRYRAAHVTAPCREDRGVRQRKTRWATLGPAIGLLAVHNVVVNEVTPDAVYVPVNLTTAGVLLGLARMDGAAREDLGLDRRRLGDGLRLGGKLAALVAAGLMLGALLPPTRSLFEDERVAGLSNGRVAYQALVRIPLGTVVLEEVAFRSVLPALFERRASRTVAMVASSALFGLWHVLPTLSALELNDLAPTTGEKVGAVTGAVVATAAGGAFLLWLRRRSGSLAAPALLHWAANGVATVTAVVVLRAR